MPYITSHQKEEIKQGRLPNTAGELNYCFTLLAFEYIKHVGERYQTYNDIMGALEGCKLELYRRKISEYENQKIKDNGDVNG